MKILIHCFISPFTITEPIHLHHHFQYVAFAGGDYGGRPRGKDKASINNHHTPKKPPLPPTPKIIIEWGAFFFKRCTSLCVCVGWS